MTIMGGNDLARVAAAPSYPAFAQALTTHKLLDASHTDLLTTGKVDSCGSKYAYGFEDAKDHDGVRWFGHGGGAPGYMIAVLANLDPREHSSGIGLLTRQSNIASQHQGNKQPDLVGEDEAFGVMS